VNYVCRVIVELGGSVNCYKERGVIVCSIGRCMAREGANVESIVSLVASGTTALATIVLAILTWRYLNEIKAARFDSVRPYLHIGVVSQNTEDSQHLVHTTLENISLWPARIKEVQYRYLPHSDKRLPLETLAKMSEVMIRAEDSHTVEFPPPDKGNNGIYIKIIYLSIYGKEYTEKEELSKKLIGEERQGNEVFL